VYFLSHLCPQGQERDALLRKAGELGSLEAHRDLGSYYATGNWAAPKDLVQAVQWYRRAAERGHRDAQYNLGFMYVLGEGVHSDPEEGLRWLRLAAWPRRRRGDAPDGGSLPQWLPWSSARTRPGGRMGPTIPGI
jgi:TPR repeat protein